jgi:hypothetical protein
MKVRRLFAILVVGGAFAGGLTASHWVARAQAQSQPLGATIYVPSDGLVFRTFDGRVVAKLAYDAHGGTFQLYDEREQPLLLGAAANSTGLGAPSAGAPANPLEDRQ